jgi:simple sugar transport system substrate-binding protein
MVTHGAPGDTFWDIIRKGAQAAAAKDNVTLKYSSDPDSGKQATLIQSAIDSKVDGIAVTLPDPPAIAPAVKKAIAAGIPVVAFNAGIGNYAESGAMSYFGSDESLAGEVPPCWRTAPARPVRRAVPGAGAAGGPVLRRESTFAQVRQDLRQRLDLPSVRTTIAAKPARTSIDYVVTLGADRADRDRRVKDGSRRPSSGRSTSTRRSRRRSSPVRSSSRSTSSRTCRATWPSTRCGSTRPTAMSSAAASPR